jgi:hypothetical protein
MSTLTLPTAWLWASPIHLLHSLRQVFAEKVSDIFVQRRFDQRRQALEGLLKSWESDTRAAVTLAYSMDMEALSLRLGRRNLPKVKEIVPVVRELLKELGELDEVATAAAGGWQIVADRIEEVLPHLTPAARRDMRAAALLIAEMLRTLPEDALSPDVFNDFLARSTDEVPDQEAQLYGLVPLLGLLGTEPRYPQALAETAALTLWRLVREGAPDDVVEDAYLSSEAAEAALEHQEEISLEDFLRAQGV